jgi:hypothetical protein
VKGFGQVIASRQLTRLDGKPPLVVEIGVPRRRRTGEWECPHRIRGLRLKAGARRRALGEDAVQALEIVSQAIWRELEPYESELSWTGEPGATGFYRYFPNYLFGPAFATRVEAAIDREVHKEYLRLKRRHERAQVSRTRRRKPRAAAT